MMRRSSSLGASLLLAALCLCAALAPLPAGAEAGGRRRLLQQSFLDRSANLICGQPGQPGVWNNNNMTLCKTRVKAFMPKLVRVGWQRRGVRLRLPAASEVAQAHHAPPLRCLCCAQALSWQEKVKGGMSGGAVIGEWGKKVCESLNTGAYASAGVDFCPPGGPRSAASFTCCRMIYVSEVSAIFAYKAAPPPAVRPVAPPGSGGIGSGVCGTKCLDCKRPGTTCTKCATGYVPNTQGAGCKAYQVTGSPASPPPVRRPPPRGSGGIGSGTCGFKCLACKRPGTTCTKCASGYVPNTKGAGCMAYYNTLN